MNEKQERFAEEYLVDLNATQAATRAGYSGKTAHQQGHALLKNPEIQDFLSSRRKELIEKLHITQERILTELASMAFANMEDYIGIDDHGLPYVDFSNVTRRQLAAVTQLTSETYYESQGDKSVPVKRVRFALGAKNKSIEQLYKLMGFAPPEKIHVEVTGAVRYTVEELRARARQIAEGIIEAEVESWRAGD